MYAVERARASSTPSKVLELLSRKGIIIVAVTADGTVKVRRCGIISKGKVAHDCWWGFLPARWTIAASEDGVKPEEGRLGASLTPNESTEFLWIDVIFQLVDWTDGTAKVILNQR